MSHSDISRDGFTLVINEEQSYFRLKERIREKNIQLGGIGQSVIIEHTAKGLDRIRDRV